MDETLKKREPILISLLPAAVILFVYSFMVALPKQQTLQDLRVVHDQVKMTAISPGVAEQARQNLELARSEVNRLRERIAQDRMQILQLGQSWRSPESQLVTIQKISEQLGSYGLSMMSQEFVDEPEISQYAREVIKVIDLESQSAPPIEFWKLEIEGSYSNVQEFLGGIDIETMHTFPVTLTMTASTSNDGQHKWSILFAI